MAETKAPPPRSVKRAPGGRASRDKGNRAEREVVLHWRRQSVDSHRVPLSGAVDGYKGDVMIHGLQAEVKCRKSGFKTLRNWLSGNDVLILKEDREDRLYVVDERLFTRMMQGWLRDNRAHRGDSS